MPYTSFHLYFREVAEKETRTITLFRDDDVIPKGSYGLLEMYCDDPGCDCRRVFLEVYDWERQKDMAFIAYGWEDEEFYRRWLKSGNPLDAREMQGPILNIGSPQSRYAPEFLKIVKEAVLSDPGYIERLKRHYQMFKQRVDPQHFPPPGTTKRVETAKPKSKKRKRH